MTTQAVQLHEGLLAWYDTHARELPWRARAGQVADPYHVWLSEIMLQQTTVAAVKPYFEKFLHRWPAVRDLAAAPQEEVLREWAGLGYYARARNLHKCAQVVAADYDGQFPASEAALLRLPGIGPYTAAAIAAIAFEQPAVVMDGNIERVMARLFAIETPLPDAKPELKTQIAGLTRDHRPGDFAQALMDLGATICTPRSPKCLLCPFQADCAAHKQGIAADLPRKAPKKQKPTRYGVAFWLERDGQVLLQRRPQKGLLGGMLGFPGTDWAEDIPASPAAAAPVQAEWQVAGKVTHVFTHFRLELEIWLGTSPQKPSGEWHDIATLDQAGLPSVMAKIVKKISG